MKAKWCLVVKPPTYHSFVWFRPKIISAKFYKVEKTKKWSFKRIVTSDHTSYEMLHEMGGISFNNDLKLS